MTTTLFGISAPLYTLPSVAALAIDAASPSKELASELESVGSAYMSEGVYDQGGELLKAAHALHALIARGKGESPDAKERQHTFSSIVAKTPRNLWAQAVSRANGYTPSPPLPIETRQDRLVICEVFGTYCLEKLAEMAVNDPEAVKELKGLKDDQNVSPETNKKIGDILAHLAIDPYLEDKKTLWILMVCGNEAAKKRLEEIAPHFEPPEEPKETKPKPPTRSVAEIEAADWKKVQAKALEVEDLFLTLSRRGLLKGEEKLYARCERIFDAVRKKEGNYASRYSQVIKLRQELLALTDKPPLIVVQKKERPKKEGPKKEGAGWPVFQIPIPEVFRLAHSSEGKFEILRAKLIALRDQMKPFDKQDENFLVEVLNSHHLFSPEEIYQIYEGYERALKTRRRDSFMRDFRVVRNQRRLAHGQASPH